MRRYVLVLLVSLPLLLGAGGTVTQPRNVLLSRFRTEPVVVIDPGHPSLIVAGGNTNYIALPDGSFPAPYFTSHDGGASFSTGTLPLIPPYTTGADPSIAIAQDGTVFYSYLGESPTFCRSGPGAILLTHSINQGISFRGPVVVDSNPADDRPTLAVESRPGRLSHVFMAWTREYPDHSEIWYARSVDGGATFKTVNMVYSSLLDNFGATPVVGPNGHIYIFWLSHRDLAPTSVAPAQVLLAASRDDGQRFGQIRGAGQGFATLPVRAEPGSLRDLTTATAGVAPSGTIYLAYASVRDQHRDGSVDADIMVTRSVDHGVTWTSPKRVNDVRTGDRFMPALSVLGNRTLGLAFYDRRAGSGQLDVYATRVSYTHGFGATRNVLVNSAPSPVSDVSYFGKGNAEGDSCFPSGRFFGDYIGISAAGPNAVGIVWADGQLQKTGETDLWFARVSLPALGQAKSVKVLDRVSNQNLFIRTWSNVAGIPGLFIVQLGLMGGSVFLVFLLLPVLAIAIAVTSLRKPVM
jgi:hypothetical protein